MVDKIRALCKEKNTTIAQIEKEAGLGNGVIAKWSIRSPRYDLLQKVANALSVSVSYLTGETDIDMTAQPGEEEVTEQLKKFILTASHEELEDVKKYIDFIKSKRV